MLDVPAMAPFARAPMREVENLSDEPFEEIDHAHKAAPERIICVRGRPPVRTASSREEWQLECQRLAFRMASRMLLRAKSGPPRVKKIPVV